MLNHLHRTCHPKRHQGWSVFTLKTKTPELTHSAQFVLYRGYLWCAWGTVSAACALFKLANQFIADRWSVGSDRVIQASCRSYTIPLFSVKICFKKKKYDRLLTVGFCQASLPFPLTKVLLLNSKSLNSNWNLRISVSLLCAKVLATLSSLRSSRKKRTMFGSKRSFPVAPLGLPFRLSFSAEFGRKKEPWGWTECRVPRYYFTRVVLVFSGWECGDDFHQWLRWVGLFTTNQTLLPLQPCSVTQQLNHRHISALLSLLVFLMSDSRLHSKKFETVKKYI